MADTDEADLEQEEQTTDQDDSGDGYLKLPLGHSSRPLPSGQTVKVDHLTVGGVGVRVNLPAVLRPNDEVKIQAQDGSLAAFNSAGFLVGGNTVAIAPGSFEKKGNFEIVFRVPEDAVKFIAEGAAVRVLLFGSSATAELAKSLIFLDRSEDKEKDQAGQKKQKQAEAINQAEQVASLLTDASAKSAGGGLGNVIKNIFDPGLQQQKKKEEQEAAKPPAEKNNENDFDDQDAQQPAVDDDQDLENDEVAAAPVTIRNRKIVNIQSSQRTRKIASQGQSGGAGGGEAVVQTSGSQSSRRTVSARASTDVQKKTGRAGGSVQAQKGAVAPSGGRQGGSKTGVSEGRIEEEQSSGQPPQQASAMPKRSGGQIAGGQISAAKNFENQAEEEEQTPQGGQISAQEKTAAKASGSNGAKKKNQAAPGEVNADNQSEAGLSSVNAPAKQPGQEQAPSDEDDNSQDQEAPVTIPEAALPADKEKQPDLPDNNQAVGAADEDLSGQLNKQGAEPKKPQGSGNKPLRQAVIGFGKGEEDAAELDNKGKEELYEEPEETQVKENLKGGLGLDRQPEEEQEDKTGKEEEEEDHLPLPHAQLLILPDFLNRQKPGKAKKPKPGKSAEPGGLKSLMHAPEAKQTGQGQQQASAEGKQSDEKTQQGSQNAQQAEEETEQQEQEEEEAQEAEAQALQERQRQEEEEAKADFEKAIKEAAELVNKLVDQVLSKGVTAVWMGAIETLGLTVLLGAIIGDCLWLLKRSIIKAEIKLIPGSLLDRLTQSTNRQKVALSRAQVEEVIAKEIKFSRKVKLNILAMNALLGLLAFIFLAFFLYVGCNYPVGKKPAPIGYGLSTFGLAGYGGICENVASFASALSSAGNGSLSQPAIAPAGVLSTGQYTQAIQQAAQNNQPADACALRVVVEKESSQKPDIIGCDCAKNGHPDYCLTKDPANYYPGFPFNWNQCSYGIGLTQWTIYPNSQVPWCAAGQASRQLYGACYTVNDLLNPQTSIDLTAKSFAANMQTSASQAGRPGSYTRADVENAFWKYVGDCRNSQSTSCTPQRLAKQQSLVDARMSLYDVCKANGGG